ncbi:MAG: hypothetical protein II401_02690 [Bacteroidales bacterium]|nr:hypothetical protein [Bacteroidales bacterium]
MAITYQISVRFRTEGECRYREERATIPRIPEWSRYCEGGRTFCKYYDNRPVELPHKKSGFYSICITKPIMWNIERLTE